MSTVPSSEEVHAGQAVYSPLVLATYDLLVLGLSNRWIWKCPTPRLLQFYNEHVTPNHLDIGVGTGYFLDRCTYPAPPRIGLVDLNPNSLTVTEKRLRRYTPTTWQRNVLEPFSLDGATFASVGMNYLFHCLPGSIPTKAVVFDHVLPHLRPGGVVFGSTLLQIGVERGAMARRLMDVYNRKGIFSNAADAVDDLRAALSNRFSSSHVEVVGCAAVFWGRTRLP